LRAHGPLYGISLAFSVIVKIRCALLGLAANIALGCAPALPDAAGDVRPAASFPAAAGDVRPGADFVNLLARRGDLAARWFSDRVDDRLRLRTDRAEYMDVLRGIGNQLGCGPVPLHSLRTFVVTDNQLSPHGDFPRIISVACAQEAARAAQFFLSAPFELSRGGIKDVDPYQLEIMAWDADLHGYRMYATKATEDPSRVQLVIDLETDLKECGRCHLAGADLRAQAPAAMAAFMRPMPLMNEMTAPWPHWNARPGVDSYDYDLPPQFDPANRTRRFSPKAYADSHFRRLTETFLSPASELESIVRAGIALATHGRLDDLYGPYEFNRAMMLLRPLFCDEVVNYVTEDGGGRIDSELVLADARALFRRARATPERWRFWGDRIALPPDRTHQPLETIPVRAAMTREYEESLLDRGALNVSEVLRLHALDYTHPVYSDFRCGLWQDAAKRADFPLGPVAEGIGLVRNVDVLQALFARIMTVAQPQGQRRSLQPPALRRVLALPDASQLDAAELSPLVQAPCGPKQGFCVVELSELASMLDGYIGDLLATPARALRNNLASTMKARACRALRKETNHPPIPESVCGP
jgi:hypothetical protein